MTSLAIIGPHTVVSLPEQGVSMVPAKVDTGAHSSSIWVSDVAVDNAGVLSFVLFGKDFPFYSGKRVKVAEFTKSRIKNSFGDSEVRYKITLPVVVEGVAFSTQFTLANRHRNRFPILIGSQSLHGRFLVDVSLRAPIAASKNLRKGTQQS